MFKVIDPHGAEVHELHMFPSSENTDKHEFTQECWCCPVMRSLSDFKSIEMEVGEDDAQIEHVIVEHNRTDH